MIYEVGMILMPNPIHPLIQRYITGFTICEVTSMHNSEIGINIKILANGKVFNSEPVYKMDIGSQVRVNPLTIGGFDIDKMSRCQAREDVGGSSQSVYDEAVCKYKKELKPLIDFPLLVPFRKETIFKLEPKLPMV